MKRAPCGALDHSVDSPLMSDVGPDLLLGHIEETGDDNQEDEHLEADALPFCEVRFGCPHQEGGDVAGILVDRAGRAVGVSDLAVGKRRRHRERRTGDEIGIVIRSLGHRDTGGRLLIIAGQEGVDIVRAAFLILREEIEERPEDAARHAAGFRHQR